MTIAPDGAVMVAVRGLDNEIYTSWTDDPRNANGWSVFAAQGGETIDQSAVTTNTTTGNILVAARAANNTVSMREFNDLGVPISDWSEESTGYQTQHPPTLMFWNAVFYLLITGLNNDVYYKQAWNGR